MNQRIRLTKTLLKNALKEMLMEQDIYRISIRDLCDKAGINRSTFYKYYGSQFDLLSEMEHDFLDGITAFLMEGDGKDNEPLEQVLRYLEQNIDFVRLLLSANVDPEFPGLLFSLPSIQTMLQDIASEDLPAHERDNKDAGRESPEEMAALIIKMVSSLLQSGGTPGDRGERGKGV